MLTSQNYKVAMFAGRADECERKQTRFTMSQCLLDMPWVELQLGATAVRSPEREAGFF